MAARDLVRLIYGPTAKPSAWEDHAAGRMPWAGDDAADPQQQRAVRGVFIEQLRELLDAGDRGAGDRVTCSHAGRRVSMDSARMATRLAP